MPGMMTMTRPRTGLSTLLVAAMLAACAAPDGDDKNRPLSPSGDVRTPAAFAEWRPTHEAEVAGFDAFLRGEALQGVVPPYQLLRSASDWQKCEAQPFAVPPEAQWQDAAAVLRLLKTLKEQGVLGEFEMHSGYRDAALNQCAGGAVRSAHLRGFAADITPYNSATALTALCGFWRAQGPGWKMGLGQYPSGRIHLDTLGHRTWGRDGSSKTSPCLAEG
jgi:hypothetical protein